MSRYITHEAIGQGGMGIVYRATDRLTGEIVALKKVIIPQQYWQVSDVSSDISSHNHKAIALAREFRLLSSLHPC